MGQRIYNLDVLMQLADGAAAVTASAVSQVAAAAVSLQLGPGRFEGVLIIDVSALDIVSNDEAVTFLLQGSATSAFSTNEVLAQYTVGATEVRPGGAIDSVVGRYEIPFVTEQHDTVYDWVRLYALVAGTTPSVTYKAFIGERY